MVKFIKKQPICQTGEPSVPLLTLLCFPTITNIVIERSTEESFNTEAVRLIQNMPKWKPAELQEIKVRSKLILPIKFNK